MSWDNTYSHNLLIALDQFAAAVLFNEPDLTVSTLCYFVLAGDYGRLKLNRWQLWLLQKVGPWLDKLQPGHCFLAAQGDFARANATMQRLATLPVPRSTP